MGKLVGWAILLVSPVWAQFGPKQTLFRDSVKGWSGTLDVHGVGSGNVAGSVPGSTGTYKADHEVKGKLTLDQYNPLTGAWFGSLDGTITISESSTVSFVCTITNTITASTNAQADFLGKPLTFNLTFDIGSDTWSIWPSNDNIKGTFKSVQTCAGQSMESTTTQTMRFMPIDMKMGFPFPATGFNLVGTGKATCPGCANSLSSPMDYTFTYNLTATVDELELVVEPQGFDTWRPQAGMTEDTPGNTLTVKATLQHANGTPLKSTDVLTKISFQLQNVSHQPGVAMNFPIKDAKSTADLQFREAENSNLIITGNEKSQADTKPAQITTATAVLTAFDWGAWGELKVIGTTPSGGQIVGHLKGDNAQTSVRLPKRTASSFIADSWKQDKGVTGKPDNDDSEEEPVGLPRCKGDGLTLYEEYRGFYENGRHIEGNPQKKDFFIRNLVGAEAEAGIFLFTDLSGLEVHKDLTDAEFIFSDRRINANTDVDTPHVVDQHGVFITASESENGANTHGFQFGVHFRPGLVSGIGIQDRFQAGRALSEQFNQTAADAATAYDRGVAHEFFHSVGVEHHGEDDHGRIGIIIHGPDNPESPTPAPALTWGESPVLILDESTGEDVAAAWYQAVQADLAGRPAYWGHWFQDMYVANPNGQHSGDDQCVMRYNFAALYPLSGNAATGDIGQIFYAVPPGSEPGGLQLCSTTAGTGINDVERQPRSRYFDAAPKHGNCKAWVCVNDNVPPDPL